MRRRRGQAGDVIPEQPAAAGDAGTEEADAARARSQRYVSSYVHLMALRLSAGTLCIMTMCLLVLPSTLCCTGTSTVSLSTVLRLVLLLLAVSMGELAQGLVLSLDEYCGTRILSTFTGALCSWIVDQMLLVIAYDSMSVMMRIGKEASDSGASEEEVLVCNNMCIAPAAAVAVGVFETTALVTMLWVATTVSYNMVH